MFDEGIGIQPSRITVNVGTPSTDSTNHVLDGPIEQIIEDRTIPEEEDTPEQVQPQCVPSPPVIPPPEPEPQRSARVEHQFWTMMLAMMSLRMARLLNHKMKEWAFQPLCVRTKLK
jgi:hypothetical protein